MGQRVRVTAFEESFGVSLTIQGAPGVVTFRGQDGRYLVLVSGAFYGVFTAAQLVAAL